MEAAVKLSELGDASGIVTDDGPDRVVANYGAALGITLAFMGDKLGLFKAMAYKGAMTSDEVAMCCYLNEPIVRDWLINVAAEGYIQYNPETDSFLIPDESAISLTDKSSLLYISGGFDVVDGMKRADNLIRTSFLNGKGKETREHHALLRDPERFSKAEYIEHMLYTWLRSIPGTVEKLNAGIKVADIGCCHGASTLIMGQSFPNSEFTGYEPHYYSVDRGNMMAIQKRARNVKYVTAGADNFDGEGYDMITFFNCLHEVGDPLAAFKHCYKVLSPDGVIMVSEHLYGYVTEASFEPLKRMFKGASVLHCLLNDSRDAVINSVDGRDELEKVVREAGFTFYRRAIDTEFNRIIEIRR